MLFLTTFKWLADIFDNLMQIILYFFWFIADSIDQLKRRGSCGKICAVL